MATKLYTVSVPEKLGDEIETYRVMLGNLSAIFRRAVQEELDGLKAVNAALDNGQLGNLSPQGRKLLKRRLGRDARCEEHTA